VLIVFRIINFAVIIGIIGYLFKKYGLPEIREQLKAYWDYFEGLANTHRLLKKEQQMIDRTIVQNQKEQDVLKERLMRWRAHVDQQNNQLILEKDERAKKLRAIMVEQQRQINQHRIFKKIMSPAIAQARATWQEQAKDKSVQHKVIATIIASMRNQ
jgi:hypothetical protein